MNVQEFDNTLKNNAVLNDLAMQLSGCLGIADAHELEYSDLQYLELIVDLSDLNREETTTV